MLAQHRYGDILKLCQYSASARSSRGTHHETHGASQCNTTTLTIAHETSCNSSVIVSDHLSYLSGLALMKTSTLFDELIYTLQRLNFQQNQQYFLLLCQCLQYLGNHDSVIELCKQLLNKELDVSLIGSSPTSSFERKLSQESIESTDNDPMILDSPVAGDGAGGKSSQSTVSAARNQSASRRQPDWLKRLLHSKISNTHMESVEFKRVFEILRRNGKINDARLWFVFATSLEYQAQYKDADLAYRLASKLASGQPAPLANGHSKLGAISSNQHHYQNVSLHISSKMTESKRSADEQHQDERPSMMSSSCSLSNYFAPHLKYAEFCIQRKADFKQASQVLCQTTLADPGGCSPLNYSLSPRLALVLSSQPNSNKNHFARAIEMLNSLDAYSISIRNPSFSYNQLALKCKQRLSQVGNNYEATLIMEQEGASNHGRQLVGGGTSEFYENYKLLSDDNQFESLDYNLAKAHIILNNIIQSQGEHSALLFECPQLGGKSNRLMVPSRNSTEQRELSAQLDKLIDCLRCCSSTCWLSASLWNNLGICYLMKQKFIASLSCLLQARHLAPLDWRIQYNLALTFMHVNVLPRALCCLLAAKNFYARSPNKGRFANEKFPIKALLAICYGQLRANNESRRLHAEMVAKMRLKSPCKILVLPLVNYLLLLLRNSQHEDRQLVNESDDNNGRENNPELILQLLDQLEQAWLQRQQQDAPQFNVHLLEVAQSVGQIASSIRRRDQSVDRNEQRKRRTTSRKAYAWTKVDKKLIITNEYVEA